eukprot:m.268267 g.268267  ORF g.268267 m.268267 type:complete len:75 (+) comp11074_c3_seq8:399-623(+)
MTKRSPPLSPVSYCRPMTKATRTDRSKGIGCFPNETLMDALARCIDPEEDGNPVNLKVPYSGQRPPPRLSPSTP